MSECTQQKVLDCVLNLPPGTTFLEPLRFLANLTIIEIEAFKINVDFRRKLIRYCAEIGLFCGSSQKFNLKANRCYIMEDF